MSGITDPAESTVWMHLGVAVAIGLLVGTERERRKGEGEAAHPAGIRTFGLVALLGGLGEVLASTALLVIGGGAVITLTAVSYALGERTDPGMTTEVALVNTFLLGAMAQANPTLASGVAVVMTLLLAARARFHDFARHALTEEELRDALLLGAAALVILPLAPDRFIGPYDVINPRTVWRLAVLVMAISSAGYIATRVLGAGRGMPLAGLAGGFVSSVATIGSMGAHAKERSGLLEPAVAGAALSTVATFIFLIAILAATNADVLRAMRLSLGAGAIVALAWAAIFFVKSLRQAHAEGPPQQGKPFSIKTAVLFAITVTVVLMLGTAVHDWLGNAGLIATMAVAGFADTHAATISTAVLVGSGQIDAHAAVVPILAALSSNTVSKIIAATATSRRDFSLRVVPGLVLVLAAAWAGWLATAGR